MTDLHERRRHWNTVYGSQPGDGVGWFQPTPSTSLELIQTAGAGPGT